MREGASLCNTKRNIRIEREDLLGWKGEGIVWVVGYGDGSNLKLSIVQEGSKSWPLTPRVTSQASESEK